MGRFFVQNVSLLGIVGTVCFLAGDAWAREPVEITKVKIDEYIASKPVRTDDLMIRFQRDYITWGAITTEEYREREGKYFTVFWKARDRSRGAVVRMEYLQANTGRQVHVQEVAVDRIKWGNNTAYFQVTGEDFWTDGDVLAWRVSVLRDGEVLAARRSFLWRDS